MRKAFTMLELLIVILILVVLAGLLIPASENVRRAGSRMSCKRNLQQLGQACHAYRDTFGHFPPGTAPGTPLPPEKRLSVHVLLVPYLEDKAGFGKFNLTAAWDAEPNPKALDESRDSYRFECGEWSTCELGMASRRKMPGWPAATPPTTTYVGMAGLGADAATCPFDAAGIGMFGYDRALKADQVKDGLANTMLVIETGYEVGPWVRGGPTTVRPLEPDAGQLTGDGFPFGGTHIRDRSFFRGREPDGFHILLGDGNVRHVQNTIHADVLAALATIAGGEEVPAAW